MAESGKHKRECAVNDLLVEDYGSPMQLGLLSNLCRLFQHDI
jgi:hypothetical protein